jgi:hypothetical protein
VLLLLVVSSLLPLSFDSLSLSSPREGGNEPRQHDRRQSEPRRRRRRRAATVATTTRRRLLLPLALEVAEGGGELRGAVAVQPPRLEGLGQQGLGLRPGLVAKDRPAQPPAAGAGGAVTIMMISFQKQEEHVSDFAVIAAAAPAARRTTAPVVAVSSHVEATTIHGAKRTTFWSVSRRRQVPAGGGRQGPSEGFYGFGKA